MVSEKQYTAIDLSHHLSDLARSRQASPLKDLQKYLGKPGLISLVGGLPSPAYFPFSAISADTLVADSFPLAHSEKASSLSWLWNFFGAGSNKEKTTRLSIPKYAADPGALDLADALQYRPATGLAQLQAFIKEFTAKVYQPAYQDYTTLIHTGNTDGWNRVVATLCNSGEGIITDEWTYPSALTTMLPYGVKSVAVAMDSQGMRSDSLRELLSGWDESVRGMRRPHVMYTVPVGQNPCGLTMGAQRKKDIYDICVQYDIIIVEDDPYFFLQEGDYVPKSERNHHAALSNNEMDDEARFISSLVPSYIKFDYQGRVIRLDTFSKTIAPGSRLGWFTCNPMFAERLERQGETSTQSPCGYGQAIVSTVLANWEYEGYIRWLRGLGAQYTLRRDNFIDCLDDEFHLQLSNGGESIWDGSKVYTAFSRSSGPLSEKYAISQYPMFSFVPPTSGMFVWIKLHFENHPAFASEGKESLEMKLWTELAEAGVLLGPGYLFAAEEYFSDPKTGHFRISFSNSQLEEMKKAVAIFARILTNFFRKMQRIDNRD